MGIERKRDRNHNRRVWQEEYGGQRIKKGMTKGKGKMILKENITEIGIYFVKGRKGSYRRKQIRNKERKDKTLN